MAYQFWHTKCKCGATSEVPDPDGDVAREQANQIFRDRGWLVAKNSEQEGAAVCPDCKPK